MIRPKSRRREFDSAKGVLAVPFIALLGGCVQVSAPDKPIEINLNINIRQEVVVKLQQDARELIQQNPGVF
ncbi:YnbE family lipoprotein [Allosphingosinicella indica]|uniref:YnbE-like lipoprotein n=1 Tax=Allosphingosinicella indica TaxID=941907 RepID=A0A1X7H054_9SPHN|nr:YnbE-like lipoprotein [Allosphingosinicella indica]